MRSLLPTLVPLLMLTLVGCDRSVDVTRSSAIRPFAGMCVEAAAPLFVIERRDVGIRFEGLTRRMLVPQGSVLFPFTLDEYRSGKIRDQSAVVIGVLPAGVQFRLEQFWSLREIQGTTLAVLTIVTVDGERIELDASELLNRYWVIFLADGELTPEERDRLRGQPILQSQAAIRCPD